MPYWEIALWPLSHQLERVFHCRSGGESGTVFALDVEGRQYLVGAMHVVEQSLEQASIDLYFDRAWHTLPVDVVGFSNAWDIAIFGPRQQLVDQQMLIRFRNDGPVLGQAVYFLGFPLGLRGADMQGWPLPIVKRGVVSMMPPDFPGYFYIDASANPGFSGAPVFCPDPQRPEGEVVLQAVLVHELGYEVQVKDANKNEIGKVSIPSNITKCVFINKAIDLIRANPIGFAL